MTFAESLRRGAIRAIYLRASDPVERWWLANAIRWARHLGVENRTIGATISCSQDADGSAIGRAILRGGW